MQNQQPSTLYLLLIAMLLVAAIDIGLILWWGFIELRPLTRKSLEVPVQDTPDTDVPSDPEPVLEGVDLEAGASVPDDPELLSSEFVPVSVKPEPRNAAFAPKWSLVHPWLVLQAGFVVAGLTQIILIIPVLDTLRAQGNAFMGSPYGVAIIIIGALLQNGIFVGLSSLFVKRYGTSLRAIGLTRPSKQQVVFGLVASILMLVAAMLLEKGLAGALSLLPPQLAKLLRTTTDETTAGGMFGAIHSIGWKIAFALVASIAAPIAEEVLFRGLLYNALKHRWGVRSAVILSALCFAAVHFGPLAVIVIFPMGMVLAIVYQRTQNLWVTIIMHMLNNAAAFALAMHASHGSILLAR